MKALKSTLRFSKDQKPVIDATAPPIQVPSASNGQVDASCNSTITVTCLLELYNAVGFNASKTNGNKIGITGYLGEVANFADLQNFFAIERPEAVGTSFKFITINGMASLALQFIIRSSCIGFQAGRTIRVSRMLVTRLI